MFFYHYDDKSFTDVIEIVSVLQENTIILFNENLA